MSLLLQTCDDPFQPNWRTVARLDLAAGRVDADEGFAMLGQLQEWAEEGILVIDDETTTSRVPPADPRFLDLLARRLGFSYRVIEGQ